MTRRNRKRGDPQTPQFLTLHHWMLKSAAFKSLSPYAVKALLCVAVRYNGRNNGRIACSVREVAAEAGVARNTAHKALAELQEAGFIVAVETGAFTLKARHATEWRLTFMPMQGPNGEMIEPDKPFMKAPRNQNTVSPRATDGLKP